jgi:Tol biopolymer transport system component
VQRNLSSTLYSAPANAPDNLTPIASGRLDGLNGMSTFPDGRIVYGGNHSGNWDLFVSDANGANSHQLIYDNRFHQSPSACDDGRTVLFATNFAKGEHIWKLDVQSGEAKQLTDAADETFPRCEALGDQLIYWGQSEKGGASFIFKMPLAGGAATRVSDRVAVSPPFMSLDGKHVCFATPIPDGSVQVITVLIDSGTIDSQHLVPPTFDENARSAAWMPDNQSMAISDTRTGTPNLWALTLIGTAAARQLTHFTSGAIWDFHYARDGKSVLIARGANPSDVVLFTSPK